MQSKDTLYVLKGQFTSKVHVFLQLVVLFIQLHLLNTQKSKSDCFSILVQAHIPGLSYLHPLGHLPLWAARGALAGSSLHGSLQVSHGAEVTVDRAVQTRREHLPAAHLTKLETFPAGPGALAPTARLPPERPHLSIIIRGKEAATVMICLLKGLCSSGGSHLGWHSRPMQKSWTGSGLVRASQYISCTSTPS